MAQRAVWRRNPGDPRTLIGWAFADAERQLRPTREGLGCLAKVGVLALFVYGHPGEALFLLAGVFLLPYLRRRPRSVEPLLTLPAVATAYPCEVGVTREGAPLGVDRGVVTFLDGWLHFEGYRTSFSLSRGDMERRKDNDHLDLREGGGLDFRADRKVEDAFASALDRWYRIDPAVRGISILPPFRLHPSGVARAWADLAFAVSKVALGVGAIILAYSMIHGGVWFIVGIMGTGALVDAWQALRRVRRFALEERVAFSNETPSTIGP